MSLCGTVTASVCYTFGIGGALCLDLRKISDQGIGPSERKLAELAGTEGDLGDEAEGRDMARCGPSTQDVEVRFQAASGV